MTDSGLSTRVVRGEDAHNRHASHQTEHEKFNEYLLAFEAEVREINDQRELAIHLCNASRALVEFDQCFYLRASAIRGPFKLIAASSIQLIDRDAPFTHWFESLVNEHIQHSGGLNQVTISLSDGYDRDQASVVPVR